MAQITELSLAGVPGGRHTFVAKAEATFTEVPLGFRAGRGTNARFTRAASTEGEFTASRGTNARFTET